MANTAMTSDERLLDLFRRQGPLGIVELVEATHVTATAVRQRLSRLIENGLVDRITHHSRRGRPSHRYQLSAKGQRSSGTNFAALALVLWRELWRVSDGNVRRDLTERLANSLASLVGEKVTGVAPDDRMREIAAAFAERNVSFVVETVDGQPSGLPVLTALACPFPDLAEEDREICDVERLMFEQLIGAGVRLAECRLDGARCCKFALN
jgi:DeoR family transcriptional regulator, suf operon transcriptional repressor